MDMQRDVEAGETTSMIKGVKSDSTRRPTFEDVDLDIQKDRHRVTVFPSSYAAYVVYRETKKKTYFLSQDIVQTCYLLSMVHNVLFGIGAFLQVLT